MSNFSMLMFIVNKVLNSILKAFTIKQSPYNLEKFCVGDLVSWAHHPQINRYVLLCKRLAELGYDKNSSILDVGCGDADLAVVLRTFGFTNVSGIDWKDAGEVIYRDYLSSYVKVDLNDAYLLNDLVRNMGGFDIVVSSDVLEHLENPSIVFNFMAKLLSENGVLGRLWTTSNLREPSTQTCTK